MRETKIVTVHNSVNATMIADLERLIEALKDGYNVRQVLSFPYNTEYYLERNRETKSEAIERIMQMTDVEFRDAYNAWPWTINVKKLFNYLATLPD